MKYLQLASVSTPAAVSTWFQDELVNRGVDAAYTFYVLSLLKEPQDSDERTYRSPGSTYRYPTQTNEKPELQRLRAKRSAVECLKSAALEDSSFESFDALVEELLARLEPSDQENSSEISCSTLNNGRTSTTAAELRTKNPPATAKTSTIRTASSNATEAKTTAQLRRNVAEKGRDDTLLKDERTLAERAKKYFEAFPALQAQDFERQQGTSLRCASSVITESRTRPAGQTFSERQDLTLSAKIKNRKLRRKDVKVDSSPVTEQFDRYEDYQNIYFKDKTERESDDHLCVQLASLCKPGVSDKQPGQLPAKQHNTSNNNNNNNSNNSNNSNISYSYNNNSNISYSYNNNSNSYNNNNSSNNNNNNSYSYSNNNNSSSRNINNNNNNNSNNKSYSNNDIFHHRKRITSSTIASTTCSSTSGLQTAATIAASFASTTSANFRCSSTEMMGSIVHEESLVSSLTKKFDSRLAAIWADAAPVDEQPSIWRISLELTAGRKLAADHDEVIFNTVPHRSHFTTILDDERDIETASCTLLAASDENSAPNKLNSEQTSNSEITTKGHYDFTEAVQNYTLITAEDEATGFREARGLPSPPTLCLKNSTLNYDKEKTAFTVVIPHRQATVHSTSLHSTFSEAQNAVQAVDFVQESTQEDLLFSKRTHFTPIRVDLEDMDSSSAAGGRDRPLSSSLEELSSYHAPSDASKRLNHKNKQAVAAQEKYTVPDVPSKVSATASDVSEGKKPDDNDDVKSLWKMVEFEVPHTLVEGDVLGVAHYWQDAAVNCEVSEELRQEILEEEDELFEDIFKEAMRPASHTSSLIEEANTTSTGYDSYQDTSLEYGAVGGGCGGGGGDGGGAAGAREQHEGSGSISAEEPCNIEYLSHFSNGSQLSSSVFDTLEIYDSAIVTSVRSIQDMQRQRKRQQKKPCTFYMEGNCRRTDCKFSHDLSNITCRFWEDNSCFKGLACPFLHGYAAPIEDDISLAGSQTSSGGMTKETTKRANKFTIDSEQDFPSLCCNSKSNSHLKMSKKSYKKPGGLAVKKPTAGRKKKKKTPPDVARTTCSDSARLASSSASDTNKCKSSIKGQANNNVLKKAV